MVDEERRKLHFIEETLEPLKRTMQMAQEDFYSMLDEYERLYGEEAREDYEEHYVVNEF